MIERALNFEKHVRNIHFRADCSRQALPAFNFIYKQEFVTFVQCFSFIYRLCKFIFSKENVVSQERQSEYKFKIVAKKNHKNKIISNIHSKNCGVKITPPVLIEDHTMHFTPVLNFAVLVQHPVVLI